MNNLERLEEKTEIVLNTKQIAILALGLLFVTILAFMTGFISGKRTQKREKSVVMKEDTKDLLSRLDELENKSRAFIAKKELTVTRKRAVNVEEFKKASDEETKRVQPVKATSGVKIALAAKSTSAREVKITKKSNGKSKKIAKRTKSGRTRIAGIRKSNKGRRKGSLSKKMSNNSLASRN
ncbi:hypothetical protein KKF34_11945 [Myxococcota bacterium]|nr:hypothetical protein [Myxococcota bacterium]MBU1380870.1 hypothetical protein [Myxococcota bacterium]MBU1497575.1 hypothetical protein [Myxococcota bacterium]